MSSILDGLSKQDLSFGWFAATFRTKWAEMRHFTSIPRLALWTLAALYAVVTTGCVILWIFQPGVARSGDPGLEARYSAADGYFDVVDVARDGPAEQAGLRAGDRVMLINGRPLGRFAFYEFLFSVKAGDKIQLSVERPGNDQPLTLSVTLGPAPPPPMFRDLSQPQHFAVMLLSFYPLLYLAVGLAMLFLRIDDPNAWLLALVFGGFLAGGPVFGEGVTGLKPFEGLIRPSWVRAVFVSYQAVMWPLGPALFNYFFAIFPNRSPLDRRLPRLKAVLLAIAAAYATWLLVMVATAGFVPTVVVLQSVGANVSSSAVPVLEHQLFMLFPILALTSLVLGLVSLVGNNLRPGSTEARRKTQVMVWGTVVGIMPVVLITVPFIVGSAPPRFPLWIFLVSGVLGCLVPLSFAYAVVKHRVLEIPVLLKRSARFLMVQWGVHILGVMATITIVLILGSTFSKEIAAHPQVSVIPAFALGALMLWLGIVGGERINKRIDRAFFRSAYDARLILENLGEKTRTATTRQELAALLEEEIRQALHPQSMLMYESVRDGQLRALPSEMLREPQAISADLPLLADLARRGQPWEVPQSNSQLPPALAASLTAFAPLQPECLVPMLGRESKLAGLLVLGARLSEESYSREDKRLLASVASQAGVALEGIGLTERMAERMEAERRSLHELEMARQVQARLFPQKVPWLRTLEFVGRCIQARQVGGDYYDFLEFAPGRLGLLLADIAGKGFSGALLMANLQANLRSQYAMAIDDLPRLLASVNRLFYESTDEACYATLFFADYDDSSRKLRYANCGHLPPLLLRACGSSQEVSETSKVEWLSSTCTVMGLFEAWQCETAEVGLAAGDTLVLYTDGITEAENSDGEQFGASRLLDTLAIHSQLPAGALLQAVVEAVQQFSSGCEQQDDITLVIARSLA